MRTSKSVREPAGGFSLAVIDKPYSSGLGADTLYGIVEPMDFIEIRVVHEPGGGELPPVLMRGFVSEVTRNEAMGADGRPQRSVSITGQDYGKLWQMLQILYLPGYIVGQDTLSAFRLFERFGVGFKTAMSGREFLTEVIDKIVNPYVAKLMPKDSPNPRKIIVDTEQMAKHGTTSVSGPQNAEGTIHDLLRRYLDVGIWNELYLEDREDGVYCVWRANPFKSVQGKKIQDDAPDVDVIDLPDEHVMSMTVSRSDQNVANYYWVRSAAFEMVSDIYRKLFAVSENDPTVNLSKYENTSAELYGIRVMFVSTEMGGDDVSSFNSGQNENGQKARDTGQANWVNDRRRILVEQNKDNIVFERATMRVRGNEKIKAGKYIRLARGQFKSEYYVVQVSHDFIPMEGFFSTLVLERGRGFIERARREGGPDSPYYAELS